MRAEEHWIILLNSHILPPTINAENYVRHFSHPAACHQQLMLGSHEAHISQLLDFVNTWGPQLNQFRHQVEAQTVNHNHALDNHQNMLTYLMRRDASLDDNLANYVNTLFEERMAPIHEQLHSNERSHQETLEGFASRVSNQEGNCPPQCPCVSLEDRLNQLSQSILQHQIFKI